MKMMRLIFLTGFLLTVSAAAVSAQSTIEQSIKNSRDQFSDIKNRSNELERMKKQADSEAGDIDSTAKFPEIKEDFERIQKINTDSLQPAAIKNPVNYASVLKFVSEINRRAARLDAKLFPAETKEKPAKNKQSIAEPAKIGVMLNNLDKYINSFVHNSIFQNVNLVDSQDSLMAQKDLKTIIETSFVIKETAKELIKRDGKK